LVPEDVDVRFFLDKKSTDKEGFVTKNDEVVLECDDSYQGLPGKVREIARWSLEHGYDHTLKLDDDVVLRPKELLASGFQSYSFVGHRNDIRTFPVPYGFAYWLDRKAKTLVAEEPLPPDNNDEVWVTRTLSKAGIVLHHDPRYVMHSGRREDFLGTEQRALRTRPPRFGEVYEPTIRDAFARCIHITWTGYRKLPESRAIEEFHKVFADTQQK